MAYIIKIRRDSTTNWETIDPILADGELALEIDTGQLKIGDGETIWSELAYISGSSSGGSTDAEDISIADVDENFTATDVEGALEELFTSVSNGKTLLATAITDKGVNTDATDSFATMADNIDDISGGGGYDTSDATAVASDILLNKTAYNSTGKITGTLVASAPIIVPNVSYSPLELVEIATKKVTMTALIPVMTDYTTPSGTASASDENSSYYAWKAFNGSTSDYWRSANYGPWQIGYDFGTATTVNSYSIQAPSTDYPTAWTFEGWDEDDEEWVILDTVTSDTNSFRYHILSESAAYAKYQINITGYQDDNDMRIYAIQMYALTEGSAL